MGLPACGLTQPMAASTASETAKESERIPDILDTNGPPRSARHMGALPANPAAAPAAHPFRVSGVRSPRRAQLFPGARVIALEVAAGHLQCRRQVAAGAARHLGQGRLDGTGVVFG